MSGKTLSFKIIYIGYPHGTQQSVHRRCNCPSYEKHHRERELVEGLLRDMYNSLKGWLFSIKVIVDAPISKEVVLNRNRDSKTRMFY